MRAGSPSNGTCVRAKRDPVGEDVIIGKRLKQMVVDLADVVAVVDERDPAERADGAGKQRTQIGLGEDLDVEGVRDAAVARLGADQVAVVEDDRAGALEAEHRAHMAHDGGAALLHQRLGIVAGACGAPRRGCGPTAHSRRRDRAPRSGR